MQGPSLSRGLVVLALAITGLAIGATTASADDFFVNSNGDVADETLNGTCLTSGGLCTLRAAIQEANNEVDNAGPDTITFSSVVFTGTGNVIDVGATSLPAITEAVAIRCQAEPATTPCAQVDSPPNDPMAIDNVLTVNASNVSISGLAVTNGEGGIAVFHPLGTGTITGFDLEHSWIGITLAGTDGSNATGLFLDPSVQGAAIGGTVADDRNVFGFNTVVGLRITGADNNTVQGSYFGVLPNGATQAAQPINIAINSADLDPTDDLASGNTIGGELSAGEQTSPECDGPCNVISGGTSGSAAGIELHQNVAFGNLPADSTTIKGNYFGLSHDASAVIANFGTSVGVGFADNVTIGTGGPAGTNRINGGGFGIASLSGAQNLQIGDNLIGTNFAGTASFIPPTNAIDVISSASAPTSVTDNRISAGNNAINFQGSDIAIARNLIGIGAGGQDLTVGAAGIRAINASDALIDSNAIANAATDAVRIQGGTGAELIGNALGLLGNGNTGAGVRILSGATGTIVGSDTSADFNDISGNLGGAVVIEGATTDNNAVLGNTGAGSSGLFIDLGADGLGATTGANEDIQAPTISSADDQSASGTAAPGATVRLFAKSSAANSEIADLLGTTVAGGGGDWEIAYGSAPAFVGATQTFAGDGTSEMAVADVVEPPAPGDTDPPETTITKKPKKKSTKRKAKFKFESSEAGSTFECKLDKKPFKACTSPFKKKVKPKKHKFKVRAIDAAGNVDPTPAKAKFKVLKPE